MFHTPPPASWAYAVNARFSTSTRGRGARPAGAAARGVEYQRRVATARQRLQQPPLVAIEAHLWRLAGRAVHAHIGDAIQPLLALLIEVGIMQKGAAVDEVAAHVANRAFHLALGLRAIGTTGARPEAPVGGEAEELEIVDQRAAFEPQVAGDHRLHLIEEQLLGHAAEIGERVLQAADRMSWRA